MEAQGHVIVRRKPKDGEPGEDANLLPWIEQWDNNKTLIGGEYVISPKMFSGTNSGTSDNPILTGIAMGRDCITMADGTTRTGIFALVKNEIVFELDPISKTYVFTGKVEIAGGKILLNNDGSGHLANGALYWDKDGILYNRHRFRILWRNIYQEMTDAQVPNVDGRVYTIESTKGTYLDLLCSYDDNRKIQMPSAYYLLGEIFDVKCHIVGRLASTYTIMSSYSPFFMFNEVKGEYENVYSVQLKHLASVSKGTLEATNINGAYGWLVSGDFDKVS